MPPKPNRGNTRISTHSSGPTKYPLGYSATVHSGTFSRLQYRMDATRRARERALQSLKQLQAEAAAAPAAPDPLPEPARARRPTLPNPLTPNHFARNWLRSANPLRAPPEPASPGPQTPDTRYPELL